MIIKANKEAQEIVSYCLLKYNLEQIKVSVKRIRRGRAYYDTRFISIPFWSFQEGNYYFYAYVLHEVSHFVNHDKNNASGHGEQFKNVEKLLLKDFGLIPIYKRAYIKALKNEAGQIIYNKK